MHVITVGSVFQIPPPPPPPNPSFSRLLTIIIKFSNFPQSWPSHPPAPPPPHTPQVRCCFMSTDCTIRDRMATSTFTQLQSFVPCPRPTTTFLKFVPCLMRIRGRGGNQLVGLHLLLLNAVHFLDFFKCLLPASRTSAAWLQWPVEVLSFSFDE